MKKVVVFVSAPEAERVHQVIATSGAGRLGNFSTTVSHAFAAPTGTTLHAIDEERIEFSCDDETYASILNAIDNVSPFTSVDSWSLETY
jgi:hypothetical protein